MRILVSFRPETRNAPFEAARLRKNIKGSLELNGIDYVENIAASPDLCHFISPEELPLAEFAEEEGIPYVVSAFFCENDPDASFFASAKKKATPILKERAFKIFAKASCVFVPNEGFKKLLNSESGLESLRVEVIEPGVNLARFSDDKNEKNQSFAQYFRFSKNEKMVFVLINGFQNADLLETIKKIAIGLPGYRIFVTGWDNGKGAKVPGRLTKKMPPNVFFQPFLDDDLYRVALSEAIAAIAFSFEPARPLFEYEAYAAKTPYFLAGNGEPFPMRIGEASKTPEEIIDILLSPSSKQLEESIIEGYEKARRASLKEVGRKLIGFYGEILKGGDAK